MPRAKIESLAQQRQWHDYRYTFKIYIPSQIATAAPCAKTPGVTLTSPAEIALNRMNFTVSCPQSWQMNVAVRPDVLVPVVMTKSLVAAIRRSPRMMWSLSPTTSAPSAAMC